MRPDILLGLSSSTSVVGHFCLILTFTSPVSLHSEVGDFYIHLRNFVNLYVSLHCCFVAVGNDNLKCGGVLINKVVQYSIYLQKGSKHRMGSHLDLKTIVKHLLTILKKFNLTGLGLVCSSLLL